MSVLLSRLLLCVVVVLSVPVPTNGASFLEDFRSTTPILPNQEIRAAWVVRHALISRESVDRVIDYAVRTRFQLLFVQVRGRGDAYYRSRLEPAASDLEQPIEAFDPLSYLIARAHAEGIAVHAWVNAFYVWSDPDAMPPPGHVAREHPDWLMADRSGARMDEKPVEAWKQAGLEGYYVSPDNPAVREHIVAVIQDIVSHYAVDGIHLDYVRYPGTGFDFGVTARTRFMLQFGVDPLNVPGSEGFLSGGDGAGSPDDGSERNDEAPEPGIDSLFRENAPTGLGEGAGALIDSLRVAWRAAQVDSLVYEVHRVIGGLPLSAAVVPDYTAARKDKGQDWLSWVQHGLVDFVVPMAYTYEPAEMGQRIGTIKRAIGVDRFLVGLPVFEGRSRYLGYSVSLLRREGILGYVLFSYNALQEERFSIRFLERVFLEPFLDASDVTKGESEVESSDEPVDDPKTP